MYKKPLCKSGVSAVCDCKNGFRKVVTVFLASWSPDAQRGELCRKIVGESLSRHKRMSCILVLTDGNHFPNMQDCFPEA